MAEALLREDALNVGSTACPSRGVVDRRIVRSRNALRSALIDLMETKGFDQINVNDLCLY